MIDLDGLKPKIDDVCRELPVKRLAIFGSARTAHGAEEFGPESDVDVLVVFDADTTADLFEKYFELKERLERVFRREVDLVVDRPFRNPVFSDSVEKTRVIVYER